MTREQDFGKEKVSSDCKIPSLIEEDLIDLLPPDFEDDSAEMLLPPPPLLLLLPLLLLQLLWGRLICGRILSRDQSAALELSW